MGGLSIHDIAYLFIWNHKTRKYSLKSPVSLTSYLVCITEEDRNKAAKNFFIFTATYLFLVFIEKDCSTILISLISSDNPSNGKTIILLTFALDQRRSQDLKVMGSDTI